MWLLDFIRCLLGTHVESFQFIDLQRCLVALLSSSQLPLQAAAGTYYKFYLPRLPFGAAPDIFLLVMLSCDLPQWASFLAQRRQSEGTAPTLTHPHTRYVEQLWLILQLKHSCWNMFSPDWQIIFQDIYQWFSKSITASHTSPLLTAGWCNHPQFHSAHVNDALLTVQSACLASYFCQKWSCYWQTGLSQILKITSFRLVYKNDKIQWNTPVISPEAQFGLLKLHVVSGKLN